MACSFFSAVRRLTALLLYDVDIVFIQRDCCLLHGVFDTLCRQLAFPEHYHQPAVLQKDVMVPPVTFAVARYLLLPERGIALGHHKLTASLVSVPKAAVDEYRRSVPPHHDIRLARYAFHIQSVPVPVRP